MDYSRPFTSAEEVDFTFQPLRPAEDNPRNIIHRLLLLHRTRDRLPMKMLQKKRKDAEKFELGPWPQASKFNSWKVLFRKEVTAGSTHRRLIREWLKEIRYLASTMDDLDDSGFIFDKHL